METIGSLAAQHASSAKALAHLLGVLRATPRTRMVPRGASRQIAQVPRVRLSTSAFTAWAEWTTS
jgi:hypothetical protein